MSMIVGKSDMSVLINGEIPLLVKHIEDTVHDVNHIIPNYTYPLSSFILYLTLVLWDMWGARRAPMQIRELFIPVFPPRYRQEYFFPDFLCLIFWAAMTVGSLGVEYKGFVLFLACLTAFVFFVTIIYRVLSFFEIVGKQNLAVSQPTMESGR